LSGNIILKYFSDFLTRLQISYDKLVLRHKRPEIYAIHFRYIADHWTFFIDAAQIIFEVTAYAITIIETGS
jgi:hypothetical protein